MGPAPGDPVAMSPASRSATGRHGAAADHTDLYERRWRPVLALGWLDARRSSLFFRHAVRWRVHAPAGRGRRRLHRALLLLAPVRRHCGLVGNDGPLFEPAFLDYPRTWLTVDLDAMPDARVPTSADRVTGSCSGPPRECAAQPRQLPHPRGDQGAHVVFAAVAPVMSSPGCRAQGPDGALRVAPPTSAAARPPERAAPAPVRHRSRHPLLDPVVRRRADGVRRVGRGHARQRRPPRRHVRHRGGHRQRHRDRPPDARWGCSVPPASGRLGRPRLPLGRGARCSCRRPVGHAGGRVNDPDPRRSVAPGPGGADRRFQAGTKSSPLRPAALGGVYS